MLRFERSAVTWWIHGEKLSSLKQTLDANQLMNNLFRSISWRFGWKFSKKLKLKWFCKDAKVSCCIKRFGVGKLRCITIRNQKNKMQITNGDERTWPEFEQFIQSRWRKAENQNRYRWTHGSMPMFFISFFFVVSQLVTTSLIWCEFVRSSFSWVEFQFDQFQRIIDEQLYLTKYMSNSLGGM